MEFTQSQEDYLKAIWENLQTGEAALRARLAEQLGVSAPAVTAALARLQQADLVVLEKDGTIRLTKSARDMVEHLVLRHNLVEKLLVEVLGLEWYKAHEEAERLEHAISPEVEARLLAMFGADGTCPHGAPLRGESSEERRQRGLVLLAEAPAGSRVRIARIFERDSAFLRYLDGKGIVPGARIEILDRSYDQVLHVSVGTAETHLGQDAAEKIWIEVEKDSSGSSERAHGRKVAR